MNNNNYYKKYIKYKTKYDALINNNLIGGHGHHDKEEILRHESNEYATINKTSEEMKEILNNGGYNKTKTTGRRNCGLFISTEPEKNKTLYLCKTHNIAKELSYVNKINDQIKLLPSIKQIIVVDSENKHYIEYEKLTGDLLDYVMNKIPMKYIDESDLSDENKNMMKEIWRYRKLYLPIIIFNPCEENKISYYGSKKKENEEYEVLMKNISIDHYTFDKLMKKIINEIEIFLDKILKIIIKKIYLLYTLSYWHGDLKLDNFAYNIDNSSGHEEFDVYFIDADSLILISDENKEKYLNIIINLYKTKCKNEIIGSAFEKIFKPYYTAYLKIDNNSNGKMEMPLTPYFLEKYLEYNNIGATIALSEYDINYDNILTCVNTREEFMAFINKN
jgi:hypothetical protein